MKRRIGIGLVAAAALLATAATALAGSGSVMKAYGGAGNYPSKLTSSPPPAGGTLPFTGLDLGIGLAVAAALVVLGVVMRRAGRRTQS